MNDLKLLGIITEQKNEKKINRLLNSYSIVNKYSFLGYGSASSSTLEYFGLHDIEKSVILSLIPENIKNELSNKLYHHLKLDLVGQGLGFVLPITSANKYLKDFYQEENSFREMDEMLKKENEIAYEMIVTIVIEGYAEKVMTSAKKAGAGGGTILMAKGMGGKMSKKIFGFAIEPGREVILNIVPKDIKKAVMEAITKDTGIKTKGMGLCFSLPIENVIGFDAK